MSGQFVANLADFMPNQQGIANMEVIMLKHSWDLGLGGTMAFRQTMPLHMVIT
jgi:hypothetical protein